MRTARSFSHFHDLHLDLFVGDERQRVTALATTADGFERWTRERVPYLHITGNPQLFGVDEDLLRTGITYDSAKFLTFVQTCLRSQQPDSAARLVTTYLLDCPARLTPDEQAEWIERHRSVLFATDLGELPLVRRLPGVRPRQCVRGRSRTCPA